ncbi:MAG: L,D-transpeptidase family protein [Pseudomonadota bacterium]
MRYSRFARAVLTSAAFVACLAVSPAALAQATSFTQSLAQSASADEAIAAWYRQTGYRTLWTGEADSARRTAFLSAIAGAADHGLPVQRYDAKALTEAYQMATTEGDRGRLEVRMTRAYLAWARDLSSGALTPQAILPAIVRDIAVTDPATHLRAIAAGDPAQVLAGLMPSSQVYAQLVKGKIALEARIAGGGWGPAVTGNPAPGGSGPDVVALRDRLVAMGYMPTSATRTYDSQVSAAVQQFQLDHGLPADGVATAATLAELNTPPEDRLQAVIVALERERWLDIDRSGRYIWVNLPDFTARIMQDGKTVFQTRAVIGMNQADRETPEFSDTMEFMVINPSWSVPRSITVKEYLPLMQRNRNAAGQLQVIDRNGRVVPRGSVNFAAYSAKTFPFALRQPPSDDNALGKVKFMFPNPNNIYLHDTPAKSLFLQEVRAFSHGCIRLAEPFDFAYALLSSQTDAPEAEFARYLDTGAESPVMLETPLPVHLVYYTAYPSTKGRITYRRDIYGRDAALFDALTEAGVVPGGVQG